MKGTNYFWKISQASGISMLSVLKVLHKAQFNPFAFELKKILTDDWKNLASRRQVNRHDCIYWREVNPNLMREVYINTQRPKRWSYYRFSIQLYLDICLHRCIPCIIDVIEENVDLMKTNWYFKRTRYNLIMMPLLDNSLMTISKAIV